jgi:hypothetical protein
VKRFPGEEAGVTVLLEEPEVDRPELGEVPDETAVDEQGSVVLCGW